MSEEGIIRVVAYVVFTTAAFGLAWTLATEFSPWVGWLALLIAFGVVGAPLTFRELDQLRTERERGRMVVEPWQPETTQPPQS